MQKKIFDEKTQFVCIPQIFNPKFRTGSQTKNKHLDEK